MFAARSQKAAKAATAEPPERTKTANRMEGPVQINPLWSQLATRVQAKLAVSAPDNPYEREADRVAEHVMRMPAPTLQRTCAACDMDGAPCPRCDETDAGLVRRKAAPAPDSFPNSVPHEIVQSLGAGRPLDATTRSFMESRFGQDFGQVRVHTDAKAAASARTVNALAYTIGRDVVFNANRYAPESPAGQRLLAHELTHVVQQSEATPVTGGESADYGVTVMQRSPTPNIMRSSLFNSTMKICRRVLESRGFAITEGGLKVTTLAQWQPSDEWQGAEKPQCGKPEFHITLVRDDPVFDNDWGDCTFPMGVPFSRQWTDLSDDDDWYLTIWTNNTNPNCCLEGYIEVAQERGLSGDSCTKPPPGPLEILHGALDTAGMLPFLGAVPDLINAGIYAIEGDWSKAGLSAFAAIPVFGDAPKGASLIYKGGKEAVQVSGDVVQHAGKAKIAKGLEDARAASKAKSAAAAKKAEKGAVEKADDEAFERTFKGGKDEGAFQTAERLKRGNLGEKLATDALAAKGHKILSYKPSILGTNQGGIDMVTLKDGFVHFIDNKALTRSGNVSSVSALTTNFAKNKDAVLKELKDALSRAVSKEEKDVLQSAVTAIEKGNYKKVVTNANLTKDNAILSGVSQTLKDKGFEFIDVFKSGGSK